MKVKPKTRPITLYQLLGVRPGDETEVIHKRYLDLAYTLHPDRNDGVDNGFSALTEAWSVLRDKARRRQYDLQLALAGGQCAACKGTGYAWRGRACLPCEGTGVAR